MGNSGYDPHMSSTFLNELDKRTLVFDGAMGSLIQALDLSVQRDFLGRENCSEVLLRTRPDLIQEIHESFLAAGADAVETNSFGCNRLVLGEFDDEIAGWAGDLNRLAAETARAACDKYQTEDRPRFVVGSIGPGTKLLTLGHTTWPAMLESYTEQAQGLIDGGTDALLIETCQDLLQIKCAINACIDALESRGKSVQDIPLLVSVTIETTGTMLLGTEIAAVANALSMFPIASLGLNCATGPVEMAEHIAWLSRHYPGRISVLPNAGLPELVDGRTVYPLGPEAFVEDVTRFIDEYGVSIVGGCCGTTPEHIRLLAEAVEERKGRKADRRIIPLNPGCSSLYSPVDFRQDTSFLIIAERTNANGSRKFKRLLNEEDHDGLVTMARDEVRKGAHLLDVCVDYVGRDGVVDISEVVSRFVRQVNAPLMIDSTEAPVIEAALQRAAGKCIVNSINLEDGERRFEDVCPLLKRYGAACVALTIDEDPEAGMARTAGRKVEIALRIHDLFVNKWGLDERDLLIDPLTFTVATGNEPDRRLALETLHAIARLHEELPNCGIMLGISNVSFGLRPPARMILNSVFLHEALQRGLTAAIVDAGKILPRNKIDDEKWNAAHWLLSDRRGSDRPEGMPEDFDPLLHYIKLFPEGDEKPAQAPAESRTLEERLRAHIIDGDDANLAEDLDEAMQYYKPVEIINDHLLEGMKRVGELFGAGQMQLPFVLQSAEVMKKSVSYLEPHMYKIGTGLKPKAKIVLATVAGDVHDIGKNLVDIILSNNGYEVVNLGIKQHIHQIVEALNRTSADAIGMSGLLVRSVGVMEENLKQLTTQGVTVPVLVGGAALSRLHAESHLRDIYSGSLYYGRDAFEALTICDQLAENNLRQLDAAIDLRVARRAAMRQKVEAMRATDQEQATVAVADPDTGVGGGLDSDGPIPRPPFWGSRVVDDVNIYEVYPYINTTALFRGQWQFKKRAKSDEVYQALIDEVVLPTFERLKAICGYEGVLQPKVVYGYWPCNRDGDDVVIFDPDNHARQIERFSFPRQKKNARRCISDFFRPLESANGTGRDVIGMSCVTMGPQVTQRARALFDNGEYAEYLYLHGLGVEAAEALAELWHRRMRVELGIAGDDATDVKDLFTQHYQGSRYSFGYPACPDMSDQARLFRLLRPDRIGCELTENWQIDPEQSTSAIIVHHRQAKYFNV